MWSISGGGSNYLIRTHFQNRGRNWAPVPDLCMSKLSVGSPCYDTCRGSKREKSINEESAAARWAGGDATQAAPTHCCIRGTSLLFCLAALNAEVSCPRDARGSETSAPPPVPPVCVSCTEPLAKQMSNQKLPENKKLSLSLSALLSFFQSSREHLQAVVCKSNPSEEKPPRGNQISSQIVVFCTQTKDAKEYRLKHFLQVACRVFYL